MCSNRHECFRMLNKHVSHSGPAQTVQTLNGTKGCEEQDSFKIRRWIRIDVSCSCAVSLCCFSNVSVSLCRCAVVRYHAVVQCRCVVVQCRYHVAWIAVLSRGTIDRAEKPHVATCMAETGMRRPAHVAVPKIVLNLHIAARAARSVGPVGRSSLQGGDTYCRCPNPSGSTICNEAYSTFLKSQERSRPPLPKPLSGFHIF